MAGITINEVVEALRTEHAGVEQSAMGIERAGHGCDITPNRCSHHEHCKVCNLLDRADGRDLPKREEREFPKHGGSRAEGPMFDQ